MRLHCRPSDLENRGAAFPPSEAQKAGSNKSSDRWHLKHVIASLLRPENERGPAVCGCGYAASEMQSVQIMRNVDKNASVSGVYHCDSPWLCPTCACRQAQIRKEKIENVISAVKFIGGVCAFVTLTVRHTVEMRLADLKAAVANASRVSRQGRAFQRIKADAKIFGVIQGVEVLHNIRTGWHYHLHLLIPAGGSADAVKHASEMLVVNYMNEINSQGFEAVRNAQNIQIAKSPEQWNYVHKGSLAWEVAGGLKRARSAKSRTPWDLAILADGGDENARRLFMEYAESMPGTRSCVLSPALMKSLHLQDEDEKIVGEEQDFSDIGEVVGSLKADIWNNILGRGKARQVLEAVERNLSWVQIERIANELGAPRRYIQQKPPPKYPDQIDISLIVQSAIRIAGWHGSPARQSSAISSAVQEAKSEASDRGRRLIIDMSLVHAAFIAKFKDQPAQMN